jgi:large subunit ribosomal protein L22
MDIIAISRTIRMSPRKVRLVADGIRNLPLDKAMNVLAMTQKRGATILNTVFKSAIANAVNNSKKSIESLTIKGIDILDGPQIKRFHPSTRGRVHPYIKRSSHIRITLEAKE